MTEHAEMTGEVRAPTPGPVVPVWLSNLAALGWRVLVVLALAAALAYAAVILVTVLTSIIAAGFVAATFAPVVRRFRARGSSRGRSAALSWLIAWGTIALVFLLVLLPFVPYAVDLLRSITDGINALQSQLAQAGLSTALTDAIGAVAHAIENLVASDASRVVASVSFWVGVGIFAFFLSFFLMLDADRGWAWVMEQVGERGREKLGPVVPRAVEQVGGFVRDATVMSAIRSVVVLVALLLTGVPFAGPLTSLVFVGGYVPYLGGFLTTGAVLAVAYVSNGGPTALLLLLLIAVVDVALGRLVGRSTRLYSLDVRPTTGAVRLHPAIVLAVQLVGLVVGGIAGVFAAVPVAAFVLALAGPTVEALAEPSSARQENEFVPVWLDRLAQWSWRALIGVGLVVVLVLLAVQLPALLGAVVLALVLAATFVPFLRRLRDRGLSPTVASFTVTAGVVVVTVAILGLTVGSLLHQASEIASASTAGAATASQAAGGSLDALVQSAQTYGGAAAKTAETVFEGLFGIAFLVALAVILTFFFLRDGGRGWELATSRFADWRRAELDTAGTRAVNVLGGYMIATGVISAFGAATQFVIMALLGIPLALPLAVLSFFGGFIPYFGSFLTTGLAFLVTVKFGTQTDILIMAAFTIIFNIVQGNIVAPLVYGRAVSLHPAIVLMAIPAGSALAGVVGMFLIVPFLGVIATTWRTVLLVFGDPPLGRDGEVAPGSGEQGGTLGGGDASPPGGASFAAEGAVPGP